MDDPASQEFTTWLQDWANGDRGAFDRLMPVVYRGAVEMQYFGGLSVEEIAEALQVSTRTAARELRAAKAALLREMARR